MTDRPRIVLLRGHQTNSWHLRPWDHLQDRYSVEVLQTERNWFDTGLLEARRVPVRTLRGVLPRGRLGDIAVRLPGDRYLGLAGRLRGASIVHSQDLGFWYSMQAARLKARLGFKLALTVWETIPFRETYRNIRTRPYRRMVLDATDLFLAATDRARMCLLLEGVSDDRIVISPPGVDQELFRPTAGALQDREHTLLSSGRLVWEKGHQDLLRAVAALHHEVVRGADGIPLRPRALIIGSGPEHGRLERYARDLGIAHAVEIRSEVPYHEIPAMYASASCLVLGSLPVWYWEEQYGMVLAEAISAGLPIIASSSGAIPEVLDGAAPLFAPGDWIGLAKALAAGPLAVGPGTRAPYTDSLRARYSSTAAAERLASAYATLACLGVDA